MSDERHDIITACLNRLEELNGEDFHGYRSEVYSAVSIAITAADSAQAAKYRACVEASKRILKILDKCDVYYDDDRGQRLTLDVDGDELGIPREELRAALAGLEG